MNAQPDAERTPPESERTNSPALSEQDDGLSLSVIGDALRRKWRAILLVGIPLAAVVAGVLWIALPQQYVAVAELLVMSQEDRLLPEIDARSRRQLTSSDYDIFRQTQASLITSAFVLNSVMRDPQINTLSMLDAENEPNPIGFLQDNLEATYPNDAEVLQVSLRGENAQELKILVDAVTDAYLAETVFSRREKLKQRLHKLREEYNTNRDEIRQQRESIHNQEVQLGARDASNSHIRHQLELEKLRKLDNSRAELESKLHEIDMQVTLADSLDDTADEIELPEYLIAEELEQDDQYNRLLGELDLARQNYSTIASTARPTAPSVQRAAAAAELIAGQLAARRRQLSRRIEQKLFDEAARAGGNETSLPLLNAERALVEKRHEAVSKTYEDQLAYVKQLDGFSARLETDREELDYAVRVNQARHAEIEDLKVQLDSPDRIRKIQDATIPKSNPLRSKLLQVSCASLLAIGLVAAGFVGVDVRSKFVNDSRQVSSLLEAPLLGKLPMMQTSWLGGRAASPHLESALVEAIDGICTALARSPNGGSRCILVTSSVGGEGKTTLASYMAAGFARTGKRVLLIDADTGNPQQHTIFGCDGEAGLCDALRDNDDTTPYISAAGYDGLYLLPAGKRDAASRRALANNRMSELLGSMRSQYDFIVIDSAPVLTNVEAMTIGRDVDSVVLSVMRDVSRTDQLLDARDRLQAVQVAVSGVVVHGDTIALRKQKLKSDTDSQS